MIQQLLSKIFIVEISFIKWLFIKHRPILWTMLTLIMFYLVLGAFERPLNIGMFFGYILNFITFGQVSIGIQYGGDGVGLTIYYIIVATIKGDMVWVGEFANGTHGIGFAILSLSLLCIVPIIKTIVVLYILALRIISEEKKLFIATHPTKYESKAKLISKIHKHIALNRPKLCKNKYRKEFVESALIREIWDEPRQN